MTNGRTEAVGADMAAAATSAAAVASSSATTARVTLTSEVDNEGT